MPDAQDPNATARLVDDDECRRVVRRSSDQRLGDHDRVAEGRDRMPALRVVGRQVERVVAGTRSVRADLDPLTGERHPSQVVRLGHTGHRLSPVCRVAQKRAGAREETCRADRDRNGLSSPRQGVVHHAEAEALRPESAGPRRAVVAQR